MVASRNEKRESVRERKDQRWGGEGRERSKNLIETKRKTDLQAGVCALNGIGYHLSILHLELLHLH